MALVVWSQRAEQELQRLHQFLAGRDTRAAGRAIHAITRAVMRLGTYPALGRITEGEVTGQQEWFIRSGGAGYLVLYQFSGERVVVLAIRHGRERRDATDDAANPSHWPR